MRIAEIFRSIQGEGLLTGTESLFVRASGCNLRCGYCDTPYASWHPEGEELSVEAIAARIERLGRGERLAKSERPGQGTARAAVNHVILTGGEPMLFTAIVSLAGVLHEAGYHITIETAGTLYLPVVCDLMSVSPKLSNSRPRSETIAKGDFAWIARHEAKRHTPDVIRRLVGDYAYQLKFVIDRPDDCDEVLRYLDDFSEIDRTRVLLMPQGTDPTELAAKAAWLEPYCNAQGLTYCPRRQIEWFGTQRGT